jgi:hypothetical protein
VRCGPTKLLWLPLWAVGLTRAKGQRPCNGLHIEEMCGSLYIFGLYGVSDSCDLETDYGTEHRSL